MSVNPGLLKRLHSEGLITLMEAARLLETTPAKIRVLIKTGTLEGFTSELDRRLKLVRKEDVEALQEIKPITIKPLDLKRMKGKQKS